MLVRRPPCCCCCPVLLRGRRSLHSPPPFPAPPPPRSTWRRLTRANACCATQANMREDALPMMVVLTDGKQTIGGPASSAVAEADNIKDDDIMITTVSFDEEIDQQARAACMHARALRRS